MGWLEVNLVCARTCMQIAKSMPFPFLEDAARNLPCVCMDCEVDPFFLFGGCYLENPIGIGDDGLVCDREGDGLSVLTGVYIGNVYME